MIWMTGEDDAAASSGLPRLTEAEVLAQVRYKQERAFIPSPTIEALVLQVIGGWEQLMAAVNLSQFLEAGPDAEWRPSRDTELPAAMNKLAEKYRIRWPHDRFAAGVNRANKTRQRLAHFFYISAVVDDEPPNRTVYFTRLGRQGESFKAKGGAVGLDWRDDEWAQQYRHEDSITEQELRATLEEMKTLIDWCQALRRLGGILENWPDLPDDHQINTAEWWIPWRTEREPLLFLRDLPARRRRVVRQTHRRAAAGFGALPAGSEPRHRSPSFGHCHLVKRTGNGHAGLGCGCYVSIVQIAPDQRVCTVEVSDGQLSEPAGAGPEARVEAPPGQQAEELRRRDAGDRAGRRCPVSRSRPR